ncbi:hypothetical protein C1S85_25315 [Vibrio parahaemolyticus]|nr:hypothetical protein C1S85_25315 [Vibrio parahaemolyticus]
MGNIEFMANSNSSLFFGTEDNFDLHSHNARLSGEQRNHNTQLLHRKHKSQFKPKPPSVANPS